MWRSISSGTSGQRPSSRETSAASGEPATSLPARAWAVGFGDVQAVAAKPNRRTNLEILMAASFTSRKNGGVLVICITNCQLADLGARASSGRLRKRTANLYPERLPAPLVRFRPRTRQRPRRSTNPGLNGLAISKFGGTSHEGNRARLGRGRKRSVRFRARGPREWTLSKLRSIFGEFRELRRVSEFWRGDVFPSSRTWRDQAGNAPLADLRFA